MACHVYNPFLRELQTIAIGEFKTEDTEAQVLFWNLLNEVMMKDGHGRAEFHGFMADEAVQNWKAVRTVFNGGPDNIMEGKERTCLWHWEDNLHRHAVRCIPSQDQEEFKLRCRQWKNSPSVVAAEAQLKSLCAWLHAGHAISKYIHMLETWIVWWHARIHHWGEHILKAMEENDQYLVPRTNLSESIHGSWLATNNGVKYMSLYDACMADLVAACLQGARHASFLGGKHIGEGPDIQRLRDRDSMWKRNAYKQENLIDLTNDVAEKIGVARAHEATSGNTTTVRKKRPRTLSSPIHVDDSHRPEYQKVNKHLQRRHSISSPLGGAEGNDDRSLLQEKEIHQTMWAIRRTNPGSVARCQGYLPSQKAKCNRLIEQGCPFPVLFWEN